MCFDFCGSITLMKRIRPLRFTRVVFGVCSSPFLLNSTIRYHLEKYRSSHTELVENLINSFYVDDVVTGASNEGEAFKLYAESKRILGDGSFNLRKFRTSSQALQLQINTAEKRLENPSTLEVPNLSLEETYTKATLGQPHNSESSMVKVLGVIWDPTRDSLHFSVADIAEAAASIEPTKRNVVSTIGRFYDPLGFLSPVIVRFKIFFQRLCEQHLQWDKPLPGPLKGEWDTLVKGLQHGALVSIPRSYFAEIDEEVCSQTLCGFCDASTAAYAAVIYLVVKTQHNTYTRFLAAKTRVSPLKMVTIPRMELLSALLLARLITTVSSALESTIPDLQMQCYTNSTVALYWISRIGKEWKPFIQNQVSEIQQKTPPPLWNHCSGITNPADLPSRGMTMAELQVSHLWRYGPDWLVSGPTIDNTSDTTEMPGECSKELKSNNKQSHNLISIEAKCNIDDIIQCERFHSYRRLVRVTAYVVRAVKIFKGERSTNRPLSMEELCDAEHRWIEASQREMMREKSFESLRSQLNLFLDEKNLWRCGGQLANADVPYSVKYPLLLPREHYLTSLIVSDAHKCVLHNGVRETLTEIRNKFWIVKGRSLVRAIIHRCVICCRHEGAPFPSPPPPPLPAIRVKEQPAFNSTGVDYAGPLIIRSQDPSKTS